MLDSPRSDQYNSTLTGANISILANAEGTAAGDSSAMYGAFAGTTRTILQFTFTDTNPRVLNVSLSATIGEDSGGTVDDSRAAAAFSFVGPELNLWTETPETFQTQHPLPIHISSASLITQIVPQIGGIYTMTLEASASENGSSPLQSKLGTNGGVGAT